jgi:hypothetical protein
LARLDAELSIKQLLGLVYSDLEWPTRAVSYWSMALADAMAADIVEFEIGMFT